MSIQFHYLSQSKVMTECLSGNAEMTQRQDLTQLQDSTTKTLPIQT